MWCVTDPDAGDTVAYSLAAPINPEIGVVDVNATTGAWTFTPEPEARLDAYLTDIDDDIDFVVNATDGEATTPISVSAPIDPAEAVQTDTIDVASPHDVVVIGDRLYVSTETGTIAVIDTTTNTVIDTVDDVPGLLAVSGDRLYVTFPGTVTVIDTTTNSVIDTITIGNNPTTTTVSGDRLYIVDSDGINATSDGTVTVIDATTNTVIDTITIGNHPNAATVSGDRLYVTSTETGTVTVIDTTTNTVVDTTPDYPRGRPHHRRQRRGRPGRGSGEPPVRRAVRDDGSVTVIDTSTNATIDTNPATPAASTRSTVGSFPLESGGQWRPPLRRSTYYDDTVSVVDTTTNTVVETVAVGDDPPGGWRSVPIMSTSPTPAPCR